MVEYNSVVRVGSNVDDLVQGRRAKKSRRPAGVENDLGSLMNTPLHKYMQYVDNQNRADYNTRRSISVGIRTLSYRECCDNVVTYNTRIISKSSMPFTLVG